MPEFASSSHARIMRAAHGITIGLTLVACLSLTACGGKSAGGSSGPQEPIPAAFDTAARTLSAEAYALASCVATADDKAKLACYAKQGFEDSADVPKVEALAGAADIMAGKRWQITAPSPGGSDSFQGMAILTFAALPNDGPMAFRNTRITLRCPADWGGPSNQQWSASIDLPFDAAYESNSKDRGTMAVEIDGKPFQAVQFSRSSFNLAADQALAFRDAVMTGKSLALTLKTVDGKTGAMKTALPNAGAGLKGYFDTFCA